MTDRSDQIAFVFRKQTICSIAFSTFFKNHIVPNGRKKFRRHPDRISEESVYCGYG